MKNQTPLLRVSNLSVAFSMYRDEWHKKAVPGIRSISFSLYAGELLAVVGSSGSGKSLLAQAIMGLLPHHAEIGGSLFYDGAELDDARKRALRGQEIALIPQSVDFLDPLMPVGKQVIGTRGTKEQQEEIFARCDLAPEVAKMYPHQLSGGMARRVLIATALMETPRLLIADEPTPGLPVEMARGTLARFRALADAGSAVLLITHDIDLALEVADRIAVFYAGATVEVAPAEDFRTGRAALRHPYSRAFSQALPQNDFEPISGAQPYAGDIIAGCLFADRCPFRTQDCAKPQQMRTVRDGEVLCVHAT
uniref:ABC transporter ATP-binding protein n=1 Tax=Ndongobacter massiliensis TaxID=1871025 RepID=UPI00093131C1|nr:ABC transporter ATP-binding protein [Ndongobacter massiliensis]